MDKQSISTGLIAGLAATLFFSISFSLLEYTIKLSIVLGVIAGISAGLLGYWSQIESIPEIPEKTNTEPIDSPKPPKPLNTWPKTPRERSGVSILSWLSRSSQVSSRRYQKSRKKY
ncbi:MULTISPECIES: hypothetical protein [Okeania]|uniref:hypothetical protein n=1 Tax=Okeania TaxID=1458928 RepID=UPI000F53EE5B|nr:MULTISPECIES: hypothetical protein [Okeania]NET14062.1 hypothetical protein [Okeania sp. SIO1H6]NES74444.1 hypothetical protein [Okeania sp. SIO1H4]NET18073.1 hypothetical protein [Okeania sp. SIO1H5]NET76308.1 hypothetical protein [Okeania sp. SIO1F9]NET96826.1 hypothetical protein [Okeania sp. SIO1H2]